jgi:hypothetical protein
MVGPLNRISQRNGADMNIAILPNEPEKSLKTKERTKL